MKLTNLSLAILVAVGVAACGGSGDDNSNKPNDPQKPNTPQNNDNKKPTPPANDNNIVDPTGTKVVDDKDLTKQNTVGTLQYIRRDSSRYDRVNNPSKQASSSPLLGTTLNDQNPSLTNIVLARQELTRTDGTPVKAQFTGSANPLPLERNGNVIKDPVHPDKVSLQQENFKNVDVLAGMYAKNTENTADKHADEANNVDDKNKINRVVNTTAFGSTYQISYADVDTNTGERKLAEKVTARTASNTQTGVIASNTSDPKQLTAIIDPVKWQAKSSAAGRTDGVIKTGKDAKDKDLYVYRGDTAANPAITGDKGKTVVTASTATTTRLGKDLVWWSSPETSFENWASRGKNAADANDMTAGAKATAGRLVAAGTIAEADGSAATNGLIRIGGGFSTLGQELNYNKETGKWEDNHNTTTRIFGRYHLAYADQKGKNPGVKPVGMNSFSGAKSFVAEHETGNVNKATQYSLGAQPTTLDYVQYGRVTTNLDLDEGESGYPDGFIRNNFTRKNDESGVDNYFYRGTNATTIEQMAALPSNATATYNGHALMYGINNDYHGGGKRNLPNAFAGATSGLGLGNFVEARVNFGTKRVVGEVYNQWLLDPSKPDLTKDKLVKFQGNITGNTVVGTATRAYVNGDDNATFKASFFGEKAEEMGGSFNSVKDADKYGDAYGANDWGGVFGATKGGSSNTFQGDDGGNVYGQNNYDK